MDTESTLREQRQIHYLMAFQVLPKAFFASDDFEFDQSPAFAEQILHYIKETWQAIIEHENLYAFWFTIPFMKLGTVKFKIFNVRNNSGVLSY